MDTSQSTAISLTSVRSLFLSQLDIGLTRSNGLYGTLIRLATRSRGEPPTQSTHVWACVSPGMYGPQEARGTPGDSPVAQIIESLWSVTVHHPPYSPEDIVAIYRPLGLTDRQRHLILSTLLDYRGEAYGVLKIPLHGLDWLFCNGRPVFRRLARSWKHQECSGLIAKAWSSAGLHFGVRPYAAQPDDIHDYCASHPERYRLIYPCNPTQSDIGV